MIRRNPVPARRGWSLGTPITSGLETRVGVSHDETGLAFRVWGDNHEKRVEEAQRVIDDVYTDRWAQLTELIEAGDFRGPNTRVVSGSGDPDAP